MTGSLTTCKSRGMPQLPRLSEKEAVILELLVARGEMYGLELVQRSGGRLKRGTVYVTLGRMEEKGLVRSHLEERGESEGPSRRLYEMTGLGHRLLAASKAAEQAFGTVASGSAIAALAAALMPAWRASAEVEAAAPGLLDILIFLGVLAMAFFGAVRFTQVLVRRTLASPARDQLIVLFEVLSGEREHEIGETVQLLRKIKSLRKRSVHPAPGGQLRRLARLLFTRRTFRLVFEPLLADMHLEYVEALANGSLAEARLIRAKYTLAFGAAVLGRLPISIASLMRLVLRAG